MSILSVVIITYNQENMILKCLDSLLSSNTRDVELVIADDCSTDNTCTKCIEWVNAHRDRFDNIVIVQQKINKGIVKNFIDAVQHSSSPYIKTIGGDDWFVDNAIDKIIDFIKSSHFDIAFSSIQVAVQKNNGELIITDEIIPASKVGNFFRLDSKSQFQCLTQWDCLPAPGALFTRHFWNSIKLNDLEYLTTGEDWAMWLLGAIHEMKFVEIPLCLVVYRKHAQSVSRKVSPRQRQGIKETSYLLWKLGFSKPEWLTIRNKIRLLLLCIIFRVVSMLPLCLIAIIDRIRRTVGTMLFQRKF